MKIILAGGHGQLGGILVRHFARAGHETVVLSRAEGAGEWPGSRCVRWDGRAVGDWAREFDGADLVVNLAGRSVNCRYGARNQREIMESRVWSTRAIGEAIARAAQPPGLWLQSSTATIYAHRYDAANDEHSGILGGEERSAPEKWNFSIRVAKAWERACEESQLPRTRKVLMRTAIVMSLAPGGPFGILLRLVKRGLGGRAGNGRQFVSWIHEQDFVRAVEWLIARNDMTGAVNLAAPHPLPNREFMGALRDAAGVRFGLPSPAWLLEIGAIFMRTETELILKSRRVVPARLLESGFAFQFPEWAAAAKDLCARVSAG